MGRRDSVFPNRPSVLRRGSLGPEPARAHKPKPASATARAKEARRARSSRAQAEVSLQQVAVPRAAGVIRRLVVLVVLGVVGWQIVSGLGPEGLREVERVSREVLDGILAELRGDESPAGRLSGTVETATTGGTAPAADWDRHLHRALELAERNQDERAEAEFMNAVFATESFGAFDERQTNVHDHFGYFYAQRGRYEEALPHYLKALEGYRHSVGEPHEHFISLARRIAYSYRELSRYEEAVTSLRTAIGAARQLHGEDYSGIAYGLKEIGDMLASQGDREAAAAAYREGLTVSARALGAEHQLTHSLQRAVSEMP